MPKIAPSMDRRRFLLCSSACAAGGAALTSAATGESGARTAAESLAVGYWRGAEDAADAPDIVPAENLPAGDPRLAHNGAWVTVHGLVGDASGLAASGLRSAALQVHFRPSGLDLTEPVKFQSWSLTTGCLPRVSKALSFLVPVDAESLGLSVDLDHEATVADRLQRLALGRSYRELSVRLDVGKGRRQPKLREGSYLIPLRQAVFRCPAAMSALDPRSEPCILFSVETAV